MTAPLTLPALAEAHAAGEIDTVVAAQVDMQGRLMGKRFHAAHFLESAHAGTHGCNYVLATDMEMETVEGYAAASWAKGYGDYEIVPDLATLRRAPWAEGTALVLCDVADHHGEAVAHAPRTLLKRQMARLAERGWTALAASELEFFLFRQSYEAAQRAGYAGLETFSAYNEDYHVLQTAKAEPILRAARNHLVGAGIPVENTKGEADAGQQEINVAYADALTMADRHAIVKGALKEIAWAAGRAVTFMAKWSDRHAGNSCHVHMSLADASGPLFPDGADPDGMSPVMKAWLAGLLAHAPEIAVFLAPYVNSYKRFVAGTFAPTRIVWSPDNRTAGFRTVGAGTSAHRVECRIGGADLNAHLAFAALIAAGLSGVERGMTLEPPAAGDAYAGAGREIPGTLREAADRLERSEMLRAAFGDAVVEHYVRAARWEVEVTDRTVTDLDLRRGFERA